MPARMYVQRLAAPRSAPRLPPTRSTAIVCSVIGTGVNGRAIEICAERATSPAPPRTSTASVASAGRGTRAARRVWSAADGAMAAIVAEEAATAGTRLARGYDAAVIPELSDAQEDVRELVRDFASREIAPHSAAWERDHEVPVDA